MVETQISVECLGSNILSKATTSGLGSIQKPLYEKYIQYRKSGKGKKSQPVWLKVNPEGITVIFPTDQPGHTQNYFYERSSINFFEAVRFTANKGNDKKYHCAFLPIDETRTLNQGYDKLFSPMEKKHNNLAKMEHPVIITCVMRRQVGVRALDCHGFVTENDSDAYKIMSAYFTVPIDYKQMSPEVPEDHRPRYQYRPPPQGQKPDLIQTEYGPYGIYKGGKPINLSDDHFRGNSRHSDRRYNQDPGEVIDQYVGNIGNDEEERESNSRYSFENRSERRDYNEGYGGPQPIYAQINRQSSEVHHELQRPGEGGYGGGNDRRDIQTNIHFRQQSGELDVGAVRNERYDGPYQQERGRLQNREEGLIRIPRPMSPVRNQPRDPPATAPKPTRALSPEPRSSRLNHRSPDSPLSPRASREFPAREAPLQPRDFPSGPVSSVSNLESRQEKQNKKPVAKVPPHLVAGIKVLPTGFVPKLESPKIPRRDIVGNLDNYYTNDDEDTYDNAMSRKEYYAARRNIHSDGYDGQNDRYYREPERQFGNNPPPDVLPFEEKRRDFREKKEIQSEDRWNFRPETESPRYQSEQLSKRNSAPPANYGKQWTYGEQLEKFKEKEQVELTKPSSIYEYEPQESGGKMVVDKHGAKMEHDYANMFSKVNIKDEPNSQLHTAGTNFESSLGYFP